MADVLHKWANRSDVQQDSEFYRSLLDRAAKWQLRRHREGVGGRRARATAAAHANWVDGFYKNNVQGAETATGYLLFIAKEYGAAPQNGTSLDDINQNSRATPSSSMSSTTARVRATRRCRVPSTR